MQCLTIMVQNDTDFNKSHPLCLSVCLSLLLVCGWMCVTLSLCWHFMLLSTKRQDSFSVRVCICLTLLLFMFVCVCFSLSKWLSYFLLICVCVCLSVSLTLSISLSLSLVREICITLSLFQQTPTNLLTCLHGLLSAATPPCPLTPACPCSQSASLLEPHTNAQHHHNSRTCYVQELA